MGKLLIGLLFGAMAIAGAALVMGGALLVAAGGSFYYVLAGAALIGSAAGLWLRRAWGFVLFGLTLAATLLWALWEVQLDGWALLPRLVAPAVVGLFLLIPAVRERAKPATAWWLIAPLAAIIIALAAAGLKPTPEAPSTAAAATPAPDANDGEWRVWGRTLAGDRFSPLSQINADNVRNLEVAWRFDSDVAPFAFHSFEATPLAVNNRLYLCLDRNVIVALDPDTGREIWRHDPQSNLEGVFAATCRGVSYYEAPRAIAECPKRILFGAHDNRLLAVNADTGEPCRGFGEDGAVDLKQGLGEGAQGVVFPTSPPTIVNGVAVISGWVTDGLRVGEPSGVVRGYDVVTGEQRWAWDAGSADTQRRLRPGETYTPGAPNAWGVFSADEALGLVYLPTGVATPDYFGAHRSPDMERYATSIVALDAATGRVRWSFQTVHHDIWDYDVGAQPVLVDLTVENAQAPALIASTKRGQFFVLDRRDGRPIYPVDERPAPQNPAEGEWTAPTQPYSGAFANVAGETLTEQDMWGATPFDQLWCRIQFRQARYEGEFTPPSVQRTIFYPGSAGGVNWGSVSIDRARGLMITNSLYMPDIGRLVPRAAAGDTAYSDGEQADAFAFPQNGTPYAMDRSIFINPIGVPCLRPPYGRISAIDLNTGRMLWSRPLGTASRAGPFGLDSHLPFNMGAPNLGGSITTASGVVFIGAAQDRMLRAFDVTNGRELWRAALPSVGAATPMTYISRQTGRQYVVIAAGGHPGLGGPTTSALIAYALPAEH